MLVTDASRAICPEVELRLPEGVGARPPLEGMRRAVPWRDTARMAETRALASLTVPLGGQQIELQQIEHASGGMALLRVRIREGKRFTVFDIDPASARAWGEAMTAWARQQDAARP